MNFRLLQLLLEAVEHILLLPISISFSLSILNPITTVELASNSMKLASLAKALPSIA